MCEAVRGSYDNSILDELEAEVLVSSLAMDSINKNGILLETVNHLERQFLQSWDDGSPPVTQAPG